MGACAAAAREAAVAAQPALGADGGRAGADSVHAGIRDIRKAKTEHLVAADGKFLAEYRWVKLGPGLALHGVGAGATCP